MSSLNSNITHYSKNQENQRWNEKRSLEDPIIKQNQMVKFRQRSKKAAIIKLFEKQL